MFPIRDHNPSHGTPFVVYALIALNVLIFFVQLPYMADDRALAKFWADRALFPVRGDRPWPVHRPSHLDVPACGLHAYRGQHAVPVDFRRQHGRSVRPHGLLALLPRLGHRRGPWSGLRRPDVTDPDRRRIGCHRRGHGRLSPAVPARQGRHLRLSHLHHPRLCHSGMAHARLLVRHPDLSGRRRQRGRRRRRLLGACRWLRGRARPDRAALGPPRRLGLLEHEPRPAAPHPEIAYSPRTSRWSGDADDAAHHPPSAPRQLPLRHGQVRGDAL